LVAIKMMTGGFAENPDLLKRFYREAKSTGMLQHPNIVIVYELGDHEGNPYLVMEYLEGEPLDKIIAARREISVVEKLGYMIQCCSGLAFAHQRGIVHRDIKPANLMVLKDGNCKLVDFGIARIGDNSMTRTGQVVGTISYMSPEQINAQVVDGRADIFSAGVMLYELLTGALPFDGKDTASTLLKIIHEDPPPLKNYIQNYPPDLDDVMKKALAKDREDRYATADDFAFDLSRVQEQLKRLMVSDYVERAKTSIAKADLAKAKEILQLVLKVDTQHAVAKELMQEVQQRLQRQVRGEQIKQLRANVEGAMSQKMFADALMYAEQALTLDKSNTELINLRDVVAAAKQRQEKLQTALHKAESAQHAGDLDSALKAAEEALALDPENSQVKSLHTSISKEVSEKGKQKQLQSLLDEARKDISARKFTAAFDVLKKAENIDATSPEIAALMKLASSGRDQESRRKDLEKFTNEIEDALSREDFQAACDKVEQALQKFANDPGLLKLKALTDKQREAGEKKKFVEEQMAVARKLLDSGKAAEAMATLEKASQKAPGETRLRSLLAIVRESAEQEKTERQVADYIHKANDARRRKDYDAAIKVLEAAHTEIEGSPEIQELLQLVREEAAAHIQRKKVDAAAEEAQRLLTEEEFEQAVSVLEAASKQAPNNEELRVLLADARQRIEGFNKKVEVSITKANKLLETRKVDEAVAFLESQAKSFARKPEFTAVLEKARTEQDKIKGLRGALEKAKASLDKNDFAGTSNILEACKKTYGDAPEIKQAVADLEAKRVAVAKTKVDKAIKDARTLLLARQYIAALKELESVGALVSAAPVELQKQFETLKKDASAGADRLQKEADLGKTIVAGSEAQTMVVGSTDTPGAATARATQPQAQRAPAMAPQRHVAPPPPKKSPVMAIVLVIVVLVVAGVGYWYYKNNMAAPQAPTSYIEINGVPWGTVKTVTSANGNVTEVNQPTPVRVPVGPGEYTVVVAGPNGEEQSQKINVSNDSPGSYTPVFEKIDVDQILQSN
ncbi:MAG TPA: protein kinase, partial [Terriglobales bacterium]|nr:protein kinase [Terriglobales bacterium]